MRSSQVSYYVPMDRADEADMWGDIGLDEWTLEAANPAVHNAHGLALLEMLWACHAICENPGDPASDR
jgi:hypothetical protein